MAGTAEVTDLQISEQVNNLKKETTSIPLIGERQSLEVLKVDYGEDDAIYQGKIASLLETYRYIRRTRPDGNCFFRGFAFGYCEHLLAHAGDVASIVALVKQRMEEAFALGFPTLTTGDFFDVLVELFDKIETGMTAEELREYFLEDGQSDYVVVAMRILTSAELQRDNDFYINFVEGFVSMKDFCSKEVEPMYLESDHLHATALTASLKVPIRVMYMDRGGDGKLNSHDFQANDGSEPLVTLLYRPGHYDLLYAV